MIEITHKKIVLDENNKPLEVIISYSEWEKIEKIISGVTRRMTKENLNKYAGILNLKEDPLDYQKRLRSEWY